MRNMGDHGQKSGQTMKKSPWRAIAASFIVLACAFFVIGMFVTFLTDKNASERDFIEYWAAGQQLVHGADPYEPTAILQLQRTVGLEGDEPRVTLSPPFAFFLMLPLGFVSAKAGLVLWLVVLIASLLLSIWLLGILFGRPDSGLHLCGYLFAPALACIMAGQLGIFLLLGIVLFLYFHESWPYLAGAALLPCTFKPHLFLPFFVALFLWVVARKAYQILAGFSIVLLGSCGLTLAVDIHVWSQYRRMMMSTRVLQAFVPTLSVAFRFLVDRNAIWLQFLPEIAACVWVIWYFSTRRAQWNWRDHGMLVLLVAAVCTPYAWFSDEAVLLPAVLAGVYRAMDNRRSLVPIAVIAGGALIELLLVRRMASAFYLWTTPAWLAWYLYATSNKGRQVEGIRSDSQEPTPSSLLPSR